MAVTELERAQALLRNLNKNGLDLETLLQPPYQAVLLHSTGTIITGNREAARIIRCSVEELTGLNSWTLYPPQSAQTIMEKITSRSEEAYQVQARRRDGGSVMVELKATNIEVLGEPVRVILLREVEPPPGAAAGSVA